MQHARIELCHDTVAEYFSWSMEELLGWMFAIRGKQREKCIDSFWDMDVMWHGGVSEVQS